jgi:diaminohydroxyphosphoribosylaminopyrimidine deaminase / 5-amino-6-(5-phosphoribosylamino)uracil reductase
MTNWRGLNKMFFSKNDIKFMKQVFRLAKLGEKKVFPNPMVGALIVDKNNIILGKGYHKYFGSHHAEIEAIKNCKKKNIIGSTLYVNLEPCAHYGKTPPCTKAIIKSGIKKVVIGMLDPNPIVSGKGVKILRKNKIKVKTGCLKDLAKKLNKKYLEYICSQA